MISAIPGSDPPVIRVFCEDESHHGRVATVAYLGRTKARRSLNDGREIPSRIRDFTGNFVSTEHPGTHWHEGESAENTRRQRLVLECPLCDLTVPLVQDKAARLVDSCMTAGVAEVRLAAIPAIVKSA